MSRRLVSIWGVLAFACNVYSLAFSGPKATTTSVIDERGISPKPTESPKRIQPELRKRFTAFEWDCGWYQGTSEASCIGTCNFWPGSGGQTIQGCCLSANTYCTFATTCYDYNAVSYSSKCDFSCQLYDNGVQACTDNFAPLCYSYTYWNGAIGYGCGSVSSLASTWLTVTSTVVSFGTEITTAVVPTFAANEFVFSSAPSARTGFTVGYTATATGYTATYTGFSSGGPDYNYGDSAALTAAAIVPLVVVLVIYGLYYLCAIAILIYMCRRSKRLVAAWYQPGGALNRGGAGAGATMPVSNVATPGVVAGAAPMYYVVPQQGAPGAAPYMAPQMTGTTMAGGGYFPAGNGVPTERGVSPVANASTISPIGSSPGTMPSQANQVAPSPGTPVPLQPVQESHAGAHEIG